MMNEKEMGRAAARCRRL